MESRCLKREAVFSRRASLTLFVTVILPQISLTPDISKQICFPEPEIVSPQSGAPSGSFRWNICSEDL